jgi:enamine deaminase RidA (YjgF/YER057c/UK114 family)
VAHPSLAEEETDMAGREYLRPETIAKTTGYSQVIKTGDTVYIAGQVAMAADGSTVGRGDPEAQLRQIWKNIDSAVKSAGGSLQNIVKTTTYVTDIKYGASVRKVREEVLRGTFPPTSTMVVVKELANPDWMVEIEAIAVVG